MAKQRRSRVRLHERADQRGPLAAVVLGRREALGLRQEELADLAGCSARFVHDVEAGKATAQLDKVLDVLDALGLHLEVVQGAGARIAVDPTLRAELGWEQGADPATEEPVDE
jgi:HTH-type transcriptional regulator / antitoxin HipB